MVYGARTTDELQSVLVDVRRQTVLRRIVLAAIRWVARLVGDITDAWQQPHIERFVLPESAPISIGRSRSCDFVVADPAVSARHAHLSRDGDEWILRDDGSLNGTFVNGGRVVGRTAIRPGDELTFGYSRFIVALPARKRRTFSTPAHA